MNKYKKYMIISLIILVITLICTTGTYAWFTWSNPSNTNLTLTINNIDVIFNVSPDINITNLSPVLYPEEGASTTFSLKKNNNSLGNIEYTITLDITTISDELKDTSFKWLLKQEDTILNNGDFSTSSNNSSITLYTGTLTDTNTLSYILYIYIDGNNENNPNMMNKSLTGTINISGEEIQVPVNLATYITNLYTNAEKEVVSTVNGYEIVYEEVCVNEGTEEESCYETPVYEEVCVIEGTEEEYCFETEKTIDTYITYNYVNIYDINTDDGVSGGGLMNDRLGSSTTDINGGNIRYYGARPNNYIYFNCSDYSNQTSDTCELWRIIGVFDGKVKLIRNKSIGTYSWDNKDTTTGAETDYGKNDWTTARLMKLLNPSDYYTIDTNDNGYGQSLYYNGESGTCFSGKNNATISCDFTSTGLKNDTTRNMISEEVYNLRGYDSSQIYPDEIYNYERATGNVYTGRPTSWNGKIALLYPSDYGYAVDFNKCNSTLYMYQYNYDEGNCIYNNWLSNVMYNNSSDFLTPNSESPIYVWYASSHGSSACCGPIYIAKGVSPVLHLNSNIEVVGNGTEDNPYRIIT